MIATSEIQMSLADYLRKHFEQDCSPHGLIKLHIIQS